MTTDVYVEQRWIDIPSVQGMTVREASDRLAAAGFTPVASPRRFTADAGDVVGSTLPPEGGVQLRTARIDLLPAGKEAVAKSADEGLTDDQLIDLGVMPNLAAGYTAEQAIAFVEAHGFRAWPRDTFNDHVDAGFVVFTEPRAGTAVVTGVIVIYVAVPSPPPDPPVRMPPDVVLKA